MDPDTTDTTDSGYKAVAVLFRMSPVEREGLRQEAARQGFESTQQLLELRVFGVAKPRRRSRAGTRARHQQELPLTG